MVQSMKGPRTVTVINNYRTVSLKLHNSCSNIKVTRIIFITKNHLIRTKVSGGGEI